MRVHERNLDEEIMVQQPLPPNLMASRLLLDVVFGLPARRLLGQVVYVEKFDEVFHIFHPNAGGGVVRDLFGQFFDRPA